MDDLLLCPLMFPQKVGTTLCVAVSTPLMVRVSFLQSPSEGWVNDVVRKSTLHTQTEAGIETTVAFMLLGKSACTWRANSVNFP